MGLQPLSLSSWESNGTPLQYSCLENPMDGGAWWATVHGVAKSRTRLSDFTFTFHFPTLGKAMATHSSVLAWRIPGTGEPGGLQSMGSHRVGHDWSNLAAGAAAAWVQNVWFRDPNMIASLQNNLPVTHTSQYLWPPTVKLSCYNATNRMRQKWHCVTLRTIHKKLIITQEVGLPWGLVLGGSLS